MAPVVVLLLEVLFRLQCSAPFGLSTHEPLNPAKSSKMYEGSTRMKITTQMRPSRWLLNRWCGAWLSFWFQNVTRCSMAKRTSLSKGFSAWQLFLGMEVQDQKYMKYDLNRYINRYLNRYLRLSKLWLSDAAPPPSLRPKLLHPEVLCHGCVAVAVSQCLSVSLRVSRVSLAHRIRCQAERAAGGAGGVAS